MFGHSYRPFLLTAATSLLVFACVAASAFGDFVVTPTAASLNGNYDRIQLLVTAEGNGNARPI